MMAPVAAMGSLQVLAGVLLAAIFLNGCASAKPQASVDQRRAAEVNAELGISYLRRNELTQAQRALDRALQFDPKLAMAHLGMASLRERQGAPDAAMEHYRRALALDSGNAYVQTNLGDLLCRQGQFDQGQALLAKAIANRSYSAREVALVAAGACDARMGRVDRAEARLREALAVDPEYPQALYEMALLTYADGRPLQTRAFLSRLAGLGVVTPQSLLLCYRAELQLGNREDAQHCASRLQRRFPESEEAAELHRQGDSRG